MVCKQGHEFEGKLSCPVCANEASAAMLMGFAERAIRNRERTYRTLDHVVVNADYWRRALRQQYGNDHLSLTDVRVPAMCGAMLALADMARQQGRVLKAIQEEQLSGKCRKCEARLTALSSEAGAKSV